VETRGPVVSGSGSAMALSSQADLCLFRPVYVKTL
jgi:hypothetical protein